MNHVFFQSSFYFIVEWYGIVLWLKCLVYVSKTFLNRLTLLQIMLIVFDIVCSLMMNNNEVVIVKAMYSFYRFAREYSSCAPNNEKLHFYT